MGSYNSKRQAELEDCHAELLEVADKEEFAVEVLEQLTVAVFAVVRKMLQLVVVHKEMQLVAVHKVLLLAGHTGLLLAGHTEMKLAVGHKVALEVAVAVAVATAIAQAAAHKGFQEAVLDHMESLELVHTG